MYVCVYIVINTIKGKEENEKKNKEKEEERGKEKMRDAKIYIY